MIIETLVIPFKPKQFLRAACELRKTMIAWAPKAIVPMPLDLPGAEMVSIGGVRWIRQYDAINLRWLHRLDVTLVK